MRHFLFRCLCAVVGLCALPVVASAQIDPQLGGGPVAPPTDDVSGFVDRIHPDVVATARRLGLRAPTPSGDGRTGRTLSFPLRARPIATGGSPYTISNFVDLDATTALGDFACGQRTYDGHNGIDMSLSDFGWTRMDRMDVEIVAAADGVIARRQDGNFDRQCQGLNAPDTPNMIAVQHDDGNFAYYLHMKNGSVTAKTVGQRVVAGEVIGLVGSSGKSTGPHLHFEMRNAQNVKIDPFAGQCGASTTMWKHQWPAQNDSQIVRIGTSNPAPQFAGACSETISDNPNDKDVFQPGDTVYGVTVVRDQNPGDTATIDFIRPDGSVARSGAAIGSVSQLYPSAVWWNSYQLPTNAPAGVWRVRDSYKNQVVERAFFVGINPAPTQLFAAVLPGGRSVQTSSPATLFATILNAGAGPAYGCWIYPDTPIDADFVFQTTDSQNQLSGSPNVAVTIPAGGAQSFLIAFTPRTSAAAEAWKTRLRFKCTNADAAPVYEDVNTALMSMSPAAVPDVIPIGVTPSNDGVVRLQGAAGTNFMAAAATNIGSAATMTVKPVVTGMSAASVSICETDPGTGACRTTPSATVSRSFATNAVATFSLFVTATGDIPFDPAARRLRLDFVDGNGVVRGQTSAALTTR